MNRTSSSHALVRVVVALAVVVAGAVVAPVAAQEGCGPAGGGSIEAPTAANGDFSFTGGGWGHGAGMSQYGAQGAARLGCDAATILGTYYPGAVIESVATPAPISIGLHQGITSLEVRADEGPIPWELCHYTSGACAEPGLEQADGSTWTISVLPDARYAIAVDGTTFWEGGDFEHHLRAVLSLDTTIDRRAFLPSTGHAYRWGVLQLDSVQRDASDMFVTVQVPSFDQYLRGIAEVPASWPVAALQAQVIAARSYAFQRVEALGIRESCRCHLYATVKDQNYEGWDHESADASGGGRWAAAVAATSGQVLRHEGRTVEAFYSSSHGGQSESARFVFGADLPYIQPVDDSRWDLASDNPYRRWTVAFTAAEVGTAAGVGIATLVRVVEPTGAGGRVGAPSRGYGGLEVTGTTGRVVLSGDEARAALRLRSTLFTVTANNPQPPPPPPPPAPPPPTEPPAGDDDVERIFGPDRVATAVEASQAAWLSSTDVVLATAGQFPDALAAVAMAARMDAPLLLTPSDHLADGVAAEMQRLGADRAWLLGGTAALATAVEAEVEALGMEVTRIAGGNRYETAAGAATVAGSTGDRTATLALGDDWPDAVAAGALAASPRQIPTLLTQRDRVPSPTLAYLDDSGIGTVLLVGGTAVIGAEVEQQLRDLDFDVRRLAGATRYETSASVADVAQGLYLTRTPLVMASGQGYADALPAGALAGRVGGVLLLVPQRDLADGPAARTYVEEHVDDLDGGIVVGGPTAVSYDVERQIDELLD